MVSFGEKKIIEQSNANGYFSRKKSIFLHAHGIKFY